MPGYVCCEAEPELGAVLQVILAESGLLSWPEQAERPIPYSYVNSDYGIDVYCSDGFDNGASRYRFEPDSGYCRYLGSHNEDTVSKVVPARNGSIAQESESNDEGTLIRLVLNKGETELILFERQLPRNLADGFAWRVSGEKKNLIIRIPNERRGLGSYYS